MTNKEHIQNMNSNELANFLADVLNSHTYSACYHCPLRDIRVSCGNSTRGKDGILRWLNAEVKTHE